MNRLHTNSDSSLLIVDGMALLFRAFYAMSSGGSIRKTSSGIPTNAVYGFVRYLFDAVATFSPSHVICCWDMGTSTFRTEKYPLYKANRGSAPDELIPQFELAKEIVTSFGIPNIGLQGYEADDCIGSLAHQFKDELEVLVLTGDHDMLQLLSERISVIIMKKGMSNYAVYTPQALLEEKSISPMQIVDLKGLTGDPSDNYPGVKGIGEKTAVKLLAQYGSIDSILENLHELPSAMKSKFEANLDMLHLSRDLAQIRCHVPVSCHLDECCWSLDPDQVAAKFEELEMSGLMKFIS